MTPLETLRATGLELYGQDWQMAMARNLQRPGAPTKGIDARLLRRWLSGERPVATWVPRACMELLRARANSHIRMASQLECIAA